MSKLDIKMAKDYIQQLEKLKSASNEIEEYSYKPFQNALWEKLTEIINVYKGTIPDIEDVVLFNKTSEYKDVESIIGKLKWYVIFKKEDKKELYKFVNTYIGKLEEAVDKLSNSLPIEHTALEFALFDEIAITVNVLGHCYSSIKEIASFRRGFAISDANSIIGKLKLENHLYVREFEDDLGDSFIRHASNILGDTNEGLTGYEIVRLTNYYALEYDIKIPIISPVFENYGSSVPNKRTALFQNLKEFNGEQKFRIISDLCEYEEFNNNENMKDLKAMLYKKFGVYFDRDLENSELIRDTQHWLSKYTKANEPYKSGIEKFKSKIYGRNVLDDMRLSFELLLKELLKNQKSLENQIKDLGKILKENNISSEIRNLIIKVIDYYTKYQNEKVKHDDKSNKLEVEYIIEQTSILMKFLIQVLEG